VADSAGVDAVWRDQIGATLRNDLR
jgi:hypothetical protein